MALRFRSALPRYRARPPQHRPAYPLPRSWFVGRVSRWAYAPGTFSVTTRTQPLITRIHMDPPFVLGSASRRLQILVAPGLAGIPQTRYAFALKKVRPQKHERGSRGARLSRRRAGSRSCVTDIFALVESVYAAGMDSAAWPAFLGRLCEAAGGHSACLLSHDAKTPKGRVETAYRLNPEAAIAYGSYFGARDPWALALKSRNALTRGLVSTGQAVVPQSSLRKTEYLCRLRSPPWPEPKRFCHRRVAAVGRRVRGDGAATGQGWGIRGVVGPAPHNVATPHPSCAADAHSTERVSDGATNVGGSARTPVSRCLALRQHRQLDLREHGCENDRFDSRRTRPASTPGHGPVSP